MKKLFRNDFYLRRDGYTLFQFEMATTYRNDNKMNSSFSHKRVVSR